MRPWRCETCQHRFHAWSVAPRYLRCVHCRKCGNLNLQRIPRDRVDQGALRGLWRLLGVPAYRCEHCRRRFFSLLQNCRIEPSRVRTLSSQ